MQAQVPTGFMRAGDSDFFDTDALSVDFGWIDDVRVVYEQASHNWAAYAPDLGGVISTGKTRVDVERNMREAIAIYREEMARDQVERPWLYGDGTSSLEPMSQG
ncbi:MAG TPA: type II toxin-antitoxin system HicB family antitoxin [Chloroflexota bacterium]|jgi:predicted RNase H-like HicB family nuclease|nr:type II toxin-antitoxin system HicB family antitoxin [Chloroflexota bacterium]